MTIRNLLLKNYNFGLSVQIPSIRWDKQNLAHRNYARQSKTSRMKHFSTRRFHSFSTPINIPSITKTYIVMMTFLAQSPLT